MSQCSSCTRATLLLRTQGHQHRRVHAINNVLQPHRSPPGGASGQGVRSVAELREVRLGGERRSVWVDSVSGYAYEPTPAAAGELGGALMSLTVQGCAFQWHAHC
jgi:hypothetical protein